MDEQVAGCIFSTIFIVIGLVIIALVGGSFRTEVEFMPTGVPESVVQTPFKEDLTARHWLGGLIKGKQPDVNAALAAELGPDKQVSQITILTRHSATDLLVTFVTMFIYCPQTVTISGTINRVPQPVAVPQPMAAPAPVDQAAPMEAVETTTQ